MPWRKRQIRRTTRRVERRKDMTSEARRAPSERPAKWSRDDIRAEAQKLQRKGAKGMTLLREMNRIMNGSGIVDLYPEFPHVYYVNMGDTYVETIIWDAESRRFTYAPWGAFYEARSR